MKRGRLDGPIVVIAGKHGSGTLAPMRLTLCLGLAILASSAQADRLIFAPTARKVPIGVARLEHLFDQADFGRSRTSLAVGLTDAIDAEFVLERGEGRGEVESFNVAFNVIPALTGISPGLSVGVQDGVGKTQDGRSLYIAGTYRIGLSGRYNGDVPLEFSHGYRFGDHSGYFVGVMFPFRENFRLLAEHDSHRVNAGIEYRPLRNLWIRSIHRQSASFWSLTVVQRF